MFSMKETSWFKLKRASGAPSGLFTKRRSDLFQDKLTTYKRSPAPPKYDFLVFSKSKSIRKYKVSQFSMRKNQVFYEKIPKDSNEKISNK